MALFFAAPRSGVRLIVDLGEVLKIKVRVDLRRRDTRVAQQFLHGAQVAARLEQMRCERVAQHVRVNAQTRSLALRPSIETLLHGSRRNARAALRDENRLLIGPRDFSAPLEPILQRGDGMPPYR